MKTKTEILTELALFSVPTGGIGSWITEQTHDDVFARLGTLDKEGTRRRRGLVPRSR